MDTGGFDVLLGGTIAAAIIKLFDHFTSKRERKDVHKRIDVVEQEVRNGRTGTPVEPSDTLRAAVDETRSISRQTLALVTAVIEEQKDMREEQRDMREEMRGLGERVAASEQGQDDLESELHSVREHVDEQLPRIVARAAQAMNTLKTEPAIGQVADPPFLKALGPGRPGEDTDKS